MLLLPSFSFWIQMNLNFKQTLLTCFKELNNYSNKSSDVSLFPFLSKCVVNLYLEGYILSVRGGNCYFQLKEQDHLYK
jgi:hypothetical protein